MNGCFELFDNARYGPALVLRIVAKFSAVVASLMITVPRPLLAEQVSAPPGGNAPAIALEELVSYLRIEEAALNKIYFEVTEKYSTVTDHGEQPSDAYAVSTYFVDREKFFLRIRRFDARSTSTTEGRFDGSIYTSAGSSSSGFNSLVRYEVRGCKDPRRFSVISSTNVFAAMGYTFPQRVSEMEKFEGVRSTLLAALRESAPLEIAASDQEISLTVRVPDTSVIAWNSIDLSYWRKQWDGQKLSKARRTELEDTFARLRATEPVRLTKFTFKKVTGGFKLTQIRERSPDGTLVKQCYIESWHYLGGGNLVASARTEIWSDEFTPTVLGHPRRICKLTLEKFSSSPLEETSFTALNPKPGIKVMDPAGSKLTDKALLLYYLGFWRSSGGLTRGWR